MRVVLPFLVALLLVVTSAVSPTLGTTPTADDELIVPGVRIGKWTLQMTIDDLLRMNGAVSPVLFYAEPARSRDFWQYSWYSVAFGAQTFDKKKVEVPVAGVGGDRNRVVFYRTDKGVTLFQSKRSDILKVYGEPTVVLGGTRFILIYDKIGLGFRLFNVEDGGIREMWVFRPGNAKNIWKF